MYGAAVPTVAFAVGLAANLIPKDQILIVIGVSIALTAIVVVFELILVKATLINADFLSDAKKK